MTDLVIKATAYDHCYSLLLLHKLCEAATAAAGSVGTVLTYNPPLPVLFRVVREGSEGGKNLLWRGSVALCVREGGGCIGQRW